MNKLNRQFAADSHTGLQRDLNEDCYGADPDLGLWVVADGVGGHPGGEVASRIVLETIQKRVAQGESLLQATRASHKAILSAVNEGMGTAGMGSTVVAVHLKDDDYEVAWVGDSRAYIYNGDLNQITLDHNRAGELLAKQAITPEQASSHPERHILTRSLGVAPDVEPEPGYLQGTLNADDHILLCTDGLTDELSDSLIKHLLDDHKTPRAQVDALMSAALDAGGRDNITVAIIAGPTSSSESASEASADSPHNVRRSASGGLPNDGKFPLRAVILLGVLALVIAVLLF